MCSFGKGLILKPRICGRIYSARSAMRATISHTFEVDLGDRSYPINIGSGLLHSDELAKSIMSKKALIVTNTLVGPMYASQVAKNLRRHGIEVHTVTLPDGEIHKNMEVLMTIINAAVAAKLDRSSTLVALGGGVVGDMCGFAASIYQRGVKFIQIPTTLMAMVDSSVGGKTAVNHLMGGKNLIGTFYQPQAVFADVDTLRTLPDREYRSGIAEVIKYGLISDPALLEWLETHALEVCNRAPAAVLHMVRRSCEIKASIVAQDEREVITSSGVRATLNLGHTFGHAVEAGLGYGTWLHGEAVALGMLMAAELSHKMGAIDASFVHRLRLLLEAYELPTDIEQYQRKLTKLAQQRQALTTTTTTSTAIAAGPPPPPPPLSRLSTQSFLDFMYVDKKVSGGRLNLVLLSGPPLGRAVVTDKFDPAMLRSVVESFTTYTGTCL